MSEDIITSAFVRLRKKLLRFAQGMLPSQEDAEERAVVVEQEVVEKYNETVSRTCNELFQEIKQYFPTKKNSDKYMKEKTIIV